ncbi:hypothetical protein TVAG_348070 [Trichomonas vaginalis G3]|uniref:Biogenesis of lysosome-related organelles complex 1 subunit 2 n=1 Tax=Trichomonas vaginalis (strain ATCC PRA-98 / G3) TaxID=412133 RepID=A2DSU8_TRIV3|nr:biogenesis of lysosome-related organelles complex 1 subunit 2 family [Trichomonas vaginalis G3]EAY16497.1 hypothetical protein TVAG_348070 [Trichomonas vaginalis G3]KAI5488022.1 biogenesis of lysosome-related organelles complex 1 subunit 2 family [Trichomonas vaginalis G3]|eukprot:XP_001328720.1 hypothetical protein [Trichomonas vaginalis G3]
MSEEKTTPIKTAAEDLTKNIAEYMQLQAEELSDNFELVFQLNQAAIGKYGELVDEASSLKEKASALQEQEIGVASFLSNLSVIEADITTLEDTISKLEGYCTLLESKVANVQH